jgi:hypothetical protein
MNIEIHIREMHSDFCNGRTLAFAEKLESLLDFADMIESKRIEFLATHDEYDAAMCQSHLANDILQWGILQCDTKSA